jgi:hypothetical protein
MRFNDFLLNEASIFDPKYPPGTQVKFSSKGSKNALLQRVLDKIPKFDAKEVLEKVVATQIETASDVKGKKPLIVSDFALKAVKNGSAKSVYSMVFKRPNGEYFTIVDSASNIGGAFTKVYGEGEKLATRAKGLVAEALLGVAMYAKLVARSGDMTQKITSEDIWAIVDRIKPSGDDKVEDTVQDRGNQVSDIINLSITLATDVQGLLTDKKHRHHFLNEVDNWVNYANSDLAQKYADVLYKNDRPDNITIMLAGKDGGKLDVGINVLDKNGRATEKFKQVKLSVKLSDGLIGQQGRGENPQEVYNNLVTLFHPLGVDLSKAQPAIIAAATKSGVKKQFIDGLNIAYTEAFTQLKALTGSLEGDVALAVRIARLADIHATDNDPAIQVIETGSAGNYRLLNYKGLHQTLAKENINIDVELRWGNSSKIPGAKIPELRFVDVNNSTPAGRLVSIRVRGRGGVGREYANHIIEPLKLLKNLAAFQRFRKPNNPQQPAQPAPAATPAVSSTASTAPVTAPVAPAPNVTTLQGNNFVSPDTRKVGQDEQEKEVAEEQGKWQPYNAKHVSELERMLHLAKYSK